MNRVMPQRVWAVSMMRDEADVAEHVVRHMAGQQVDGILIADNLSTDGTRDILESLVGRLPCPLVIVDDNEKGYYQSRKMTLLAERAVERGATWIVPFDADEIWHATDHIGRLLREAPDYVHVSPAPLYNYMPTSVDPEGVSFERIQWRIRERAPLPKVAFRWQTNCVIEQGNHNVKLPRYGDQRERLGKLTVAHFPWRSFEQYKRKVSNGSEAYRATDLPEDQGLHWRGDGAILRNHGEDALHEKWAKWFFSTNPQAETQLEHSPAPFAPCELNGRSSSRAA